MGTFRIVLPRAGKSNGVRHRKLQKNLANPVPEDESVEKGRRLSGEPAIPQTRAERETLP
jgi:hypothetical protein